MVSCTARKGKDLMPKKVAEKKQSRAAFVRSLPKTMAPDDVIKRVKEAGHYKDITAETIGKIRWLAKANAKKKSGKSGKPKLKTVRVLKSAEERSFGRDAGNYWKENRPRLEAAVANARLVEDFMKALEALVESMVKKKLKEFFAD